jgi:serine/threonine-protein kinase
MPTTERLRAALADRYAVEHEIGSGGMATVYLARDVKHDREVALKVLRADLSAVIGAERFLSEVRITAKLDHPHILTLIDSGSADGILFYVLPYVRGETLRARLTREKQLGIDDALAITKQVASALDYAHRQGVVHRDIKPENILFQEGEAVLADFGIALAVKEAGGNRLTETGLSLGTPQYMSPEQATGDRALDARSDIYSLGAVLYEMLAGEPPVTGATAQAVIAKLLTERPTSVRVVRDTVPPGVDAALTKSLAKVPADRFRSAGDFVRALEAASATVAETRPRRSSMIPYAIGGGFLLALSGWLGARALRDDAPRVTLGDRKQITFTGRVGNPAISGDGTQLAYVVSNCRPSGCAYGVEIQDVGGSATRRLYDGATALYSIDWSPDRRNILIEASINGVYGTYLLSTLGGTPRRISPWVGTFWSADSLVFVKTTHPAPDYWVYFSGLDATPRDSIRVAGVGELIQGMGAIPGAKWLVLRVSSAARSTWLALDRSGREQSRISTGAVSNMSTSSDAVWGRIKVGAASQHPVVARIEFDANRGRFSGRVDTVYKLAAPDADFSVTADGTQLVFAEGIAEYDVLAGEFRDGLKGALPRERAVLHTTSSPRAYISPDGKQVLVGRTDGSVTDEWRWSLMPVSGGAERPLNAAGIESSGFWADSVTVAMSEHGSKGRQLSLIDVRTNARRAMFALTDSTNNDFTALPGGGWAWIGRGDTTIMIQNAAGDPARQFAIPHWYLGAFSLEASRDGRSIAIAGWSAPSADSIGVSVFSMVDGRETHWATVFGENAGLEWLYDGSLLLFLQATGESFTVARLRGPGQSEQLGAIPRPLVGIYASFDMAHIAVVARDRHGDAWSMRVVKR